MWKAAFTGRSETGGGGGSVSGRSNSQRKKSRGAESVTSSSSRKPEKSTRGSTYGDETSTYVTAPSSRGSGLTESALRTLDDDEEDDWEDDDKDARSERKSVRSEGSRKHRRRSEKERSRSRSRSQDHKKGTNRRESRKESETSRGKTRREHSDDERAIPNMGSFSQFPGQYSHGHMGPSGKEEIHMMSGALPSGADNQFGLTRADTFGQASDYYLDEGQSVTYQPGFRKKSPNMLVNPDLDHLMTATSEAHPVEDTGHGSAADFYGGKGPRGLDSTPGKASSSSNKPSKKPSRTSSLGTAAAAGIGVRAVEGSGSQFQSASHSQYQTSSTSYQQQSNSYSSKPGKSSSRDPGLSLTGEAASYYAPPPQQQSSNTPGKQSSQSNAGLYTAGAAIAGAAAYGMQEQNQQQNGTFTSSSQYGRAPSYSTPQRPGSNATGTQQQHFHEHKGPMTRLKDGLLNLVSNEEDVIKMEMYTEYIGVCKHCFDPRTSPNDAPRVHHYHHSSRNDSFEDLRKRRSIERMRKGSKERLNRQGSRVDKDNRYYPERRGSGGKAGIIGAGLAGVGLAAGANALFSGGKDFDDTYSVKTGHRESSAVRRRSRSSSRELRRRSSHGVIGRDSKDEYFTVRTSDGRTERRRVQRSRSTSKDRNTGLMGTAAGAAVGASAVGAMSSRPGREDAVNGAYVRRRRSRSSSSNSSAGFFGGFFSPSQKKSKKKRRDSIGRERRKKKQSGLFGFGGGSASSSDTEMAFGDGFSSKTNLPLRRKSSTKSVKSSKKRKSDEHLAATVAGIAATAGALEAARRGRITKRSSRPDLGGKKIDLKTKEDKRRIAHAQDDGEWVDELPSDVDDASSVGSDIVYGDYKKKPSKRQSMESIGSQSSGAGGLGAWGWRWGGKEKRKPSRASVVSPGYVAAPDGNSMGTIGAGLAAGAVAGAAMDAAQQRTRDASVMSSSSSLPQAPMHYVDPRPVSSEAGSLPGSRHASMPGAFDSPVYATARPGPAPLQQPQPITPVKPIFTQEPLEMDDRDAPRPPPPRRTQSSPSQSSFAKDAALIGAAALGTAGIIASQGRKSKESSNVRFGLTDEQERKHERERRREQEKVEEEERRRTDRTRALKEEAAREFREQEVLRARAAENQKAAEAELERQRVARRQVEEQAELDRRREREYREREAYRVEQDRREHDQRVQAKREQDRRELDRRAEETRGQEDDRRKLREQDRERQVEIDRKRVDWEEKDRRSRDLRTTESREIERKERDDSKDSSLPWGAVVAGAAAAGVGAVAMHEIGKDKEREIERREEPEYRKSNSRSRERYSAQEVKPSEARSAEVFQEDDILDPEFFKKKRTASETAQYDQRARKAAAKVITDRDAYYHEPAQSQAEFFAPEEILHEPSEGKTKVADPIDDNNVRIVDAADDARSVFDQEYGSSRSGKTKDAPYGVPELNLISPTPPPSAPSLSRKKSAMSSPLAQSQARESVTESSATKSARSRSISWGADQTHVYDAPTPDSYHEDRDSYIEQRDVPVGVGVAAAMAAAGFAAKEAVQDSSSKGSTRQYEARSRDMNATAQGKKGDVEDDKAFYQQPFYESVSDIGPGTFALASPGTEGAPPVQGFVEGEVTEPPSGRDERRHVPGGFDDEEDVPLPATFTTKSRDVPAASTTATRDSEDARVASIVAEAVALQTPEEELPPPVDLPGEPDWEPPLSKKEKKKRDKAAKREGTIDNEPYVPIAEELEAAPIAPEPEVEPTRESRLSKKEKKKRDKQSAKQGLAEVAGAVMTASGIAAVTADIDDNASDFVGSNKGGGRGKTVSQIERDLRDVEPTAPTAEVTDATEISAMPESWGAETQTREAEHPITTVDPFQYQVYDVPPERVSQEPQPYVNSKRSGVRFREPEIASPLRPEVARRDYIGKADATVDEATDLVASMPTTNGFTQYVDDNVDAVNDKHTYQTVESSVDDRSTETATRDTPEDLRSVASEPTGKRSSRRDTKGKKSRRSSDYYDDPESYDDTRSTAASEPVDAYENSRRSKRRSRHEDDDTASVASSRSRREREESETKKEKKSVFFGLFGRKPADEASSRVDEETLSRKSTKDSYEDDNDTERKRHRRKSKDSEYSVDDDEKASRRDHHRRRTDDQGYDQDQSFLESRVEDMSTLPGNEVSTDSAIVKQEQDFGIPVSAEQDTDLMRTQPADVDESLRDRSITPAVAGLEASTDHELSYVERPVPQEEELDDLPALPDSLPTSPTAIHEGGASQRPLSLQRPPSSTAVPLRFPFGHQPVTPSPRVERAISFGGSIPTSPASPMSTQKGRQGRPASTEIRPLYIVERNRKTPEVEEMLPSLPSSKQTSRASSMIDSDEYESAAEDVGFSNNARGLSINTAAANALEGEDDYLDSQQTTPRATEFPSILQDRAVRLEPQFYTWEDFMRDEKMHGGAPGRIGSSKGSSQAPSEYGQDPRSHFVQDGIPEDLPPLPPSRPGSPTSREQASQSRNVVAVGAMLGGATVLAHQIFVQDDKPEVPQSSTDARSDVVSLPASPAASTDTFDKASGVSDYISNYQEDSRDPLQMEVPESGKSTSRGGEEFVASGRVMEDGASSINEDAEVAASPKLNELDRFIQAEEQMEEGSVGASDVVDMQPPDVMDQPPDEKSDIDIVPFLTRKQSKKTKRKQKAESKRNSVFDDEEMQPAVGHPIGDPAASSNDTWNDSFTGTNHPSEPTPDAGLTVPSVQTAIDADQGQGADDVEQTAETLSRTQAPLVAGETASVAVSHQQTPEPTDLNSPTSHANFVTVEDGPIRGLNSDSVTDTEPVALWNVPPVATRKKGKSKKKQQQRDFVQPDVGDERMPTAQEGISNVQTEHELPTDVEQSELQSSAFSLNELRIQPVSAPQPESAPLVHDGDDTVTDQTEVNNKYSPVEDQTVAVVRPAVGPETSEPLARSSIQEQAPHVPSQSPLAIASDTAFNVHLPSDLSAPDQYIREPPEYIVGRKGDVEEIVEPLRQNAKNIDRDADSIEHEQTSGAEDDEWQPAVERTPTQPLSLQMALDLNEPTSPDLPMYDAESVAQTQGEAQLLQEGKQEQNFGDGSAVVTADEEHDNITTVPALDVGEEVELLRQDTEEDFSWTPSNKKNAKKGKKASKVPSLAPPVQDARSLVSNPEPEMIDEKPPISEQMPLVAAQETQEVEPEDFWATSSSKKKDKKKKGKKGKASAADVIVHDEPESVAYKSMNTTKPLSLETQINAPNEAPDAWDTTALDTPGGVAELSTAVPLHTSEQTFVPNDAQVFEDPIPIDRNLETLSQDDLSRQSQTFHGTDLPQAALDPADPTLRDDAVGVTRAEREDTKELTAEANTGLQQQFSDHGAHAPILGDIVSQASVHEQSMEEATLDAVIPSADPEDLTTASVDALRPGELPESETERDYQDSIDHPADPRDLVLPLRSEAATIVTDTPNAPEQEDVDSFWAFKSSKKKGKKNKRSKDTDPEPQPAAFAPVEEFDDAPAPKTFTEAMNDHIPATEVETSDLWAFPTKDKKGKKAKKGKRGQSEVVSAAAFEETAPESEELASVDEQHATVDQLSLEVLPSDIEVDHEDRARDETVADEVVAENVDNSVEALPPLPDSPEATAFVDQINQTSESLNDREPAESVQEIDESLILGKGVDSVQMAAFDDSLQEIKDRGIEESTSLQTQSNEDFGEAATFVEFGAGQDTSTVIADLQQVARGAMQPGDDQLPASPVMEEAFVPFSIKETKKDKKKRKKSRQTTLDFAEEEQQPDDLTPAPADEEGVNVETAAMQLPVERDDQLPDESSIQPPQEIDEPEWSGFSSKRSKKEKRKSKKQGSAMPVVDLDEPQPTSERMDVVQETGREPELAVEPHALEAAASTAPTPDITGSRDVASIKEYIEAPALPSESTLGGPMETSGLGEDTSHTRTAFGSEVKQSSTSVREPDSMIIDEPETSLREQDNQADVFDVAASVPLPEETDDDLATEAEMSGDRTLFDPDQSSHTYQRAAEQTQPSPVNVIAPSNQAQRDMDFTATVAAGLADTGFSPDMVVGDPTFQRRASPTGMIAEADPQEDHAESGKKRKKGKKGKRALEVQDSAAEQSPSIAQPMDDFEQTLQKTLVGTGFDTALLQQTSSSNDISSNEVTGDSTPLSFTTSKKKKGKKARKLESMTDEQTGVDEQPDSREVSKTAPESAAPLGDVSVEDSIIYHDKRDLSADQVDQRGNSAGAAGAITSGVSDILDSIPTDASDIHQAVTQASQQIKAVAQMMSPDLLRNLYEFGGDTDQTHFAKTVHVNSAMGETSVQETLVKDLDEPAEFAVSGPPVTTAALAKPAKITSIAEVMDPQVLHSLHEFGGDAGPEHFSKKSHVQSASNIPATPMQSINTNRDLPMDQSPDADYASKTMSQFRNLAHVMDSDVLQNLHEVAGDSGASHFARAAHARSTYATTEPAESTKQPARDDHPAAQLGVPEDREMDIDEMDRAYKAYKRNKRKQKKQKVNASQSGTTSEVEALERTPTIERNNLSRVGTATRSEDQTVTSEILRSSPVAAARSVLWTENATQDQASDHDPLQEPNRDIARDTDGSKSGMDAIAVAGLGLAAASGIDRADGVLESTGDGKLDNLAFSNRNQSYERPTSAAHDYNTRPATWSFENLHKDGKPMLESPLLGQKQHEVIRDSGYQEMHTPVSQRQSVDSTGGGPAHIQPSQSRESLHSRRSTEPLHISTDTGSDWGLNVAKTRNDDDADRGLDIQHARNLSQDTDNTPLQPTTKNRASYLFQTTPEILRELNTESDLPTPSARSETSDYFRTKSLNLDESESSGQETSSDRKVSSPPPVGTMSPRIPLDPIPEEYNTHKRTIRDTDAGEQSSIKAIRRTETPQSIRTRERELSPTLFQPMDAVSGSNQMTREPLSADTVIKDPPWSGVDEAKESVSMAETSKRKASRSTSIDLRSPSVMSNRSNASAGQFRAPEELRSFSRTSNRSGTPTLRRIDRSLSGDLRAASRRGDSGSAVGSRSSPKTIPFEAPPTPPSYDDEPVDAGASRSADMSDVYQGYGDAQASQASPTRPPNMRKRQSMHIIELESKLDQLVAENQALQDTKQSRFVPYHPDDNEGQSIQSTIEARDLQMRERDNEIDQIRAMLQPMQEEIARLTEINDGLTEANRNLVDDTNGRYATLQEEHAHAHEQWTNTSRELEDARQEHGQLTSGMREVVEAEIATALASKNSEVRELREELDVANERIRALQVQIQSTKGRDFLVARDEDYFDGACQKLCQHVQQWVLRFSKLSDNRICRLLSDLKDDKIEARLDNAILDGSDVDKLLVDRIKRRDVFMSLLMTMVWEYVFTRYLFGMDREQRQKLKSLEKTLAEVGPPRAVAQWRATTLTLLAKRPAFAEQRDMDAEAVGSEIFGLLCTLLPPPSSSEQQLLASLQKVISIAVDLSVEMRCQRSEYIMLPPLQPEYDTNGDLVRKVHFNASLMNERSGMFSSNSELEESRAVVKIVLFPLVVKKGDEVGEGEEEIVVCPAQVLVHNDNNKGKKIVRVQSGAMEIDRRSMQSLVSNGNGSMQF